jgi:hypothetical protein
LALQYPNTSQRVTRSGNKKPRLSGVFLEPSDGLEPSTPSLPCAPGPLRSVASGCQVARLSLFDGSRVCDWLTPVAPAWLHKCSIPSAASPRAACTR